MDLDEARLTIDLQRGHIEALERQVAERDATIADLKRIVTAREAEIARLRAPAPQDKSERFVPPVLPGILLDTPASNDVTPPAAPERKGHVREHDRALGHKRRPPLEVDPARVRDEHRHVYPEATTCSCCAAALVSIGDEQSEVIEREPVRFRRIITHRHKMACSRCKQGGVTIAPVEDPPLTGAGPVGVSLAIDIAIMHHADHLPYHRIAEILRREGLTIDRATLSRVAGRVADLLRPLVELMERDLLSSDAVLGIDGTSIKILSSPHCIRRTVYVLHGLGHVVFRLLTRGSADHVLAGFEPFTGVALADAATVHIGAVSAQLGLTIALCNAHARRYFFDARATAPEVCEHVLGFYRTVAFFERSWADLSPTARQEQRASVLAPKFATLHGWAMERLSEAIPRTPVEGALRYLLNHWKGLTHFLSDGRVPWTNNGSERLLRHIAVGRHAWVFRGSIDGAKRACVLWSLMQSCRVLNIDPRTWLIDTLRALEHTPKSRLYELTPQAWAARRSRSLAAA